jgi:hypothetical protein
MWVSSIGEIDMNALRNSLVAAAACLTLITIARADDITPDTAAATPSLRSRAEVKAEVIAARTSGRLGLAAGEDSGSFMLARLQPASTLTRAEVVAELKAARASGEWAAMLGEDSGSFHLARMWSRPHPANVAALR